MIHDEMTGTARYASRLKSATMLGEITRIVAEIAVLWVVWHHSHWSVALVLTLLTINSEIVSKLLDLKGE